MSAQSTLRSQWRRHEKFVVVFMSSVEPFACCIVMVSTAYGLGFYPVYTTCCELGVPFAPDWAYGSAYALRGWPAHLSRSGCTGLFGSGDCGWSYWLPLDNEAIAVATKHPNVFIDTSAYTTDRYPPQLVEFMRHHGSHKVLFGSNYQ